MEQTIEQQGWFQTKSYSIKLHASPYDGTSAIAIKQMKFSRFGYLVELSFAILELNLATQLRLLVIVLPEWRGSLEEGPALLGLTQQFQAPTQQGRRQPQSAVIETSAAVGSLRPPSPSTALASEPRTVYQVALMVAGIDPLQLFRVGIGAIGDGCEVVPHPIEC